MNMLLLTITLLCAAFAAAVTVAFFAKKRENAHLLRETQRLRDEHAALAAGRAQAETEIRQQLEQQARIRAEYAALKASSEAELAALRSKAAEERAREEQEQAKLEERLRLQFKNLANEILGEQSQRFRETNRDAMEVLLKPFRDNMVDFRKRVEEIHTAQTSQSGELKGELNRLMELNRRITAETANLTNALKGNSKVQGDWGEMLLETILDSSALIKGIHYETQYNVKDEEGRNLRPDVVLRLPDRKAIVIDSKVSLTAFVAYTAAESAAEREQQLKAHAASVRQHVTELGRKEYQKRFNSPDFVILFMPNEPAFLEVLKYDQNIWSDAYAKKVIISSPTNLFALLKMVADLWKYHEQDQNTQRIANYALKIYNQATAVAEQIEEAGRALDRAYAAYGEARKRITSGNDNIVRVGENLQKLIQSKKHFPARMIEEAGIESQQLPEEHPEA